MIVQKKYQLDHKQLVLHDHNNVIHQLQRLREFFRKFVQKKNREEEWRKLSTLYFDGRRKKIPKTRSEVLITPLKNNRGQIEFNNIRRQA